METRRRQETAGQRVGYRIAEDAAEAVRREAYETRRSQSLIVSEILRDHYAKKNAGK